MRPNRRPSTPLRRHSRPARRGDCAARVIASNGWDEHKCSYAATASCPDCSAALCGRHARRPNCFYHPRALVEASPKYRAQQAERKREDTRIARADRKFAKTVHTRDTRFLPSRYASRSHYGTITYRGLDVLSYEALCGKRGDDVYSPVSDASLCGTCEVLAREGARKAKLMQRKVSL